MNTPLLPLIAALAFGALGGASLSAADSPALRGSTTNRLDRIKAITEQLKLTADQQEKLRPILQEEMTKTMEIFRDTSTSREQKIAKVRELRDASRQKVKTILTSEQLEKWDKLRPNRPRSQLPRPTPSSK